MNWRATLQITCATCNITVPASTGAPHGTLIAGTAFMESVLDETTIEDRIRSEMAAAFEAVEQASAKEMPRAESRLNQAVRGLYDLIGYGKLPSDWRFNRSVRGFD
jgi:hypothetical protein